ncbi:MAG: hypothetical protein HZA81_00205 [Candidatus Taylorbacteria bacterium]|nr:hypothetical protein [Candidatus Taylorbacteria bacterium]
MRTFFALSLLLSLFVAPLESASAHVYLEDGPMEVFTHIEPDDDPIVGAKADFFFIFSDSTGRFDSSNCDCVARLISEGVTVFEKELFEIPDPTTDSFQFTLPSTGIYDLEIVGAPLEPGLFEPFEVHRIIRAERVVAEPVAEAESSGFSMRYVLFGLAAAAIAILFASESARSRKGSAGKAVSGAVLFIAALSILAIALHEARAFESALDPHCADAHECCRIQAADISTALDASAAITCFVERGEDGDETGFLVDIARSIKNKSPPTPASSFLKAIDL